KIFDSLTGVTYVLLDIGVVESPFNRLLYAQVGGIAYGEPAVPTDSDSNPVHVEATTIKEIFPNPAKRQIILTYHLSLPAAGSVEVFDSWGRRVFTDVRGQKDFGIHHARLELVNLPTGQYYVRLVSSSAVSPAQSITIIK